MHAIGKLQNREIYPVDAVAIASGPLCSPGEAHQRPVSNNGASFL